MMKSSVTNEEIDAMSPEEIEERYRKFILHEGDIVERPDQERQQRGVVTWCGRDNDHAPWGHGGIGLSKRDYIIEYSTGTTNVTDNFEGQWVRVPRGAWSAQDRLRHAYHSYERPCWLEEGEEVQECDTWEYALMRALYESADAVDDDPDRELWADTPSLFELAMWVAEQIDASYAGHVALVEPVVKWAAEMGTERLERRLQASYDDRVRALERDEKRRIENFEKRVAEALETWRIQQSLKTGATLEQLLEVKLYA